MGLLDTVIGAVSNNTLGEGGLQNITGVVGKHPQLLELATSLLGNDGGSGGLQGLVDKFKNAGLGDVIASWIGTGQNQAISGEQLGNVLGRDVLSGLANKLGVSSGDIASQLSGILPGLVDKLTPSGQIPADGVGTTGDLMGVLGSVFKR